jgi:hypothetical protein
MKFVQNLRNCSCKWKEVGEDFVKEEGIVLAFTIGSVVGLVNMHGYSTPHCQESASVITATQHPVYCKDRWENEIGSMPIAFNMLQFFKGEARL